MNCVRSCSASSCDISDTAVTLTAVGVFNVEGRALLFLWFSDISGLYYEKLRLRERVMNTVGDCPSLIGDEVECQKMKKKKIKNKK